jgi:hypothetical protein
MTDLINLYRQAEDYFFRGIASKCLDLIDDAHAYMTGGAGLNFIYMTRNTNALAKILIQGKQFFDQDNRSFDVIIPQGIMHPSNDRCFKYHGLSPEKQIRFNGCGFR